MGGGGIHHRPTSKKGEYTMQTCVKASRAVCKVLFVVSAILIAIATAFAAFNSLTRFCLSLTFNWAEELCTYCVVMMVYLAMPMLEHTGDQLCITAIDLWVKKPLGQRILNYFRGLVTGAAMVILGWNGFNVMLKAFKRNQVTYILQLPKGVLYAIAVACLVIAVLVWLIIMICNKGDFDNEPG